MTLKQIEELEALAAKATAEPWKSDYCGDVWTEAEKEYCPGMDQHLFRTIGSTTKGPGEKDAAFIAASREAVPALCQTLREAINTLETFLWPAHKTMTHEEAREEARAFLDKWEGK